MPAPVEILLCILLFILIVAALRLYNMLGDIKATMANIEQTRQEVMGTVQKVDRLLTDEITPTLQVARQTLSNVEITTKALADTTEAARRLTLKTETMAQTAQMLLMGGSVAKGMLQKKGSPDAKANSKTLRAGLVASVGTVLLGLLKKRQARK